MAAFCPGTGVRCPGDGVWVLLGLQQWSPFSEDHRCQQHRLPGRLLHPALSGPQPHHRVAPARYSAPDPGGDAFWNVGEPWEAGHECAARVGPVQAGWGGGWEPRRMLELEAQDPFSGQKAPTGIWGCLSAPAWFHLEKAGLQSRQRLLALVARTLCQKPPSGGQIRGPSL